MDWGKGQAFVDGSFATMPCPGWMLGVVKGQVEGAGGDSTDGWDFADVFPGGPANWGGTFLTVPETSEHPAEAAKLAQWLTSAESQAAAFEAAGTFPSSLDAQQSEAVTGANDLTKFFNDAPIGKILANRAEGVKAQFKGPERLGHPGTGLRAGDHCAGFRNGRPESVERRTGNPEGSGHQVAAHAIGTRVCRPGYRGRSEQFS